MDPPAVDPPVVPRSQRQLSQRQRGPSRRVELILYFTIAFNILMLRILEPIALHSVQNHNNEIDLPSKPQSEGLHQISNSPLKQMESNELSDDVQSTEQSASVGPKTKINAVTDINHAPIALEWRSRLISLGYDSSQVAIVVADDASLQYFSTSKEVRVEPLLHPSSKDWPVADPKLKQQKRRRRLFATRWVYVLYQLRMGRSILLTDADNIFVRYLDMAEFEDSTYDVIHAYCHNFPIRFLSMGFVVCGGMMWLRGNDPGGNEDGPAVRYVLSILRQCQWHDSELKNQSQSGVEAALCDDQQVINSKFFSNSLNYTWGKRPEQGFWKGEAWGNSSVTGHSFGFWSVEIAYRGPVDGFLDDENDSDNNNGTVQQKQCPNTDRSWVAMPYNTIQSEKLNGSTDRLLRFKQWFQFCRNETNITA